MQYSPKRAAVIGGGISGLAAAYQLQQSGPQHGWEFTLFEGTARLGGIIETVQQQGFTVECGPDSWVTEKPWARELAEELGLRNEVMPCNESEKRTYLAQHGALTALPDGMRMMVPTVWPPLLASPLFSPAAKLAYQREPERAAELKDTSLLSRGEYTDESVGSFVRRHFGDEVTDKVAGPLLAGVFGGDVAKLSVRAVMAPFVKMEAEYGSLISALQSREAKQTTATFTTLRSGLETLTRTIAAHLPPASLLCDTPVHALGFDGRHWTVESARGAHCFDAVFLATSLAPTRQLLRSVKGPPAEAAAALLPSEASSAIVVSLGIFRPRARTLHLPRGFGFLTTGETHAHEGNPSLLACTFMEQKFAHRAPEGGVLLRAFFGGEAAGLLTSRSDREIAEGALGQLRALLGPLPEPELTVVRRWPESLPQYAVGHLGRMSTLQTHLGHLPGLHLLGNSYRGVGLPDLVRDARTAVRQCLTAVPRATAAS